MQGGIRVEIVCTVHSTHTRDDVFQQTSIVNNLKSVRTELF